MIADPFALYLTSPPPFGPWAFPPSPEGPGAKGRRTQPSATLNAQCATLIAHCEILFAPRQPEFCAQLPQKAHSLDWIHSTRGRLAAAMAWPWRFSFSSG